MTKLRRPSEFASVFANSSSLRGQTIELRVLRTERSTPRLGLVMAKRYAKNAVLRNLLKRLAREAFRKALPVLPSVDLVCRLVKKPLISSTRVFKQHCRHEMDGLFARVRP
ncbi:MAG: ribonuclease P protein component [Rhodocyclaceae bacterium]|nr:ribonuclease P protein component [Rhodocyclaceae bacterium]